MAANGAVNLIAHPSLTGINTDTGLSGSTQWHNAVRSRMWLRSPKPEPGEQPDNDLREIVFKKNNYGPVSESIVLRWQKGLFLPVPGAASLDKLTQESKADEQFLTFLDRFGKQGRNVSHVKTAPNYAPAEFAKEPEAKGAHVTKDAFAKAMTRLFADNKIHVESYGRPSRPYSQLAMGAKPSAAT